MKRGIGFLIYTIVVIGGSYLFQNHEYFKTALYVMTVLICLFIASSLMPGIFGMNPSRIGGRDINYCLDNEERQSALSMSMTSVLLTMYLVVPFFISIYLFC